MFVRVFGECLCEFLVSISCLCVFSVFRVYVCFGECFFFVPSKIFIEEFILQIFWSSGLNA